MASSRSVVAVGERVWTWRDTRRVALAAGTLLVGGLLAREGVPAAEREVFEAVNGLPGWLYEPIWPLMQLGSLPGGLLVAAALGLATRRRTVLLVAAGAVTGTWLASKAVKELVQRSRPFGSGIETVFVRDDSIGFGYASGHTAVAFAAYTIAAPHLRPGWRPVALGLAAFVGFARVYSGAHLPLDVVGGAALGVILGEAFRMVETLFAHERLPDAPPAPD